MTVVSFFRRRFPSFALALGTVLMLSACAETELASHYFKKMSWSGAQETGGNYKVGNPYTVSGVRYHPREDFRLVETGIASWYGPNFHGKRTANGEIYNQNELTAAHRTLQMPSIVRVTNLENGKSVVVRINDRGPFKRGRVIDVSKKAATLLGFIGNGTARVRVEVLEKESRQIAAAANRGMDTSRTTVAELNRMQATPVAVRTTTTTETVAMPRSQQVAMLKNDAEILPESLQTPTITVEELGAPGKRAATDWGIVEQKELPPAMPQATRQEREEFVKRLNMEPSQKTDMATGRIEDGRFMPDPVVSRESVRPTGIFVQAGSFSVEENAVRLSQKLSTLGAVRVDPVNVNGRSFWRVRVGPLASVDEADRVLDQVVRTGGDGAKVIRN